MPFVRLTAEPGFVPSNKKAELLSSVHEAVVTVEGEAMRTGIGVVLDEVYSTLNVVLFVELIVIRDALTEAQRQHMLTAVVEAAVQTLGEESRMGVWGILSESVASGEWSIGGNPLTIEAMNRIKRGENPWPKQ